MPDNPTIKIQATVVTATEALRVITEHFEEYTQIVAKNMPRREHLSLMGKDDVYMRSLAQLYSKAKGINSITFVGQEARTIIDYMDILYTASTLKKRGALGYFELDLDKNGQIGLNIEEKV